MWYGVRGEMGVGGGRIHRISGFPLQSREAKISNIDNPDGNSSIFKNMLDGDYISAPKAHQVLLREFLGTIAGVVARRLWNPLFPSSRFSINAAHPPTKAIHKGIHRPTFSQPSNT